jgi:hypothetical protein
MQGQKENKKKIVFVAISLFPILSIYVWDNFTNHWTFFTMKNAFLFHMKSFWAETGWIDEEEGRKTHKSMKEYGERFWFSTYSLFQDLGFVCEGVLKEKDEWGKRKLCIHHSIKRIHLLSSYIHS